MQSNSVFTFSYRFRMLAWAVVALLLGAAMLLIPYRTYGITVMLLPWGMTAAVIWRQLLMMNRKKRSKLIYLNLLLLAVPITLWFKPMWCDAALWYCLLLYLVLSGYHTLRPTWAKALEKQSLWRYLGVLTAWGFAVLLLLRPRSALSDALTLLGFFMIGWGLFQLLLPPPRE